MTANLVKLVEVGPRDGLQNEPRVLSTKNKIALINRLSETGLSQIEVSSFVNPKNIPQLADAREVFSGIKRKSGVSYSALVPNEKGLARALASQVNSVAVFTAASNQFCQKNINCTIEESIDRFRPVVTQAKNYDLPVRAYVSCVLGCPYEGAIEVAQVIQIVETLWRLGCTEISLGDTIGVGMPDQVGALIQAAGDVVPMDSLAVHFHDTHGRALQNILTSLTLGIRVIDSAVAGLGGCPYADGATGNVASERVVELLHNKGYVTGVDLDKLIDVGKFILGILERTPES